jgi:hypothetical protein
MMLDTRSRAARGRLLAVAVSCLLAVNIQGSAASE